MDNRNIDLSLKSPNSAQRRGARFLSVAFKETDPSSLRLREEFHQLAELVISHEVLVEPSLDRGEGDYEERALRLNDINNFGTYVRKLQALKAGSNKR